MYETLIGIGVALAVVILSITILAVAILAKILYLYIFYTVDDDIIKPKDHLIDDLYDTNIGGKK